MYENGKKWEMNFLGTYNHNLDDKNRLSMPKKIVSKIVDTNVIVSKGFEGCLELRTKESFEKRCQEILSYSQNKKASRILAREILANSHELEIDKAGRILIPSNLLQLAKIKKDVIIIGLGNKLEIWDKHQYEQVMQDADKVFEEVAERVDDDFSK